MQSLFEPLLPREQDKRDEHVCLEGVQKRRGDTLKFKSNKRTYTIKCHKGPRKSIMYGSGWRKFVADNKLGNLFYLD